MRIRRKTQRKTETPRFPPISYPALAGLIGMKVLLYLGHSHDSVHMCFPLAVLGCRHCLLFRHYQKTIFSYFFEVLGVRDQSQSLLQALRLNFPSKMRDLDAYVSSYCIFRRFCWVWKVAKPFSLPCRSQGGCASSRLDHGFLNSSFGSAGTVPCSVISAPSFAIFFQVRSSLLD